MIRHYCESYVVLEITTVELLLKQLGTVTMVFETTRIHKSVDLLF